MGCTIVFVILLVIGMGILCFLTGDMTAFIALAATLVIGLGLAGILYCVYRSRQRRKRGNPLSPTLRWMNAAGSILIAANRRTNFYRMAGFRYNDEPDRKAIQAMLWEYWEIQGHEAAIKEMRGLIDMGMRIRYRQEMEVLSRRYQNMTEVQLIEEARKANPNADARQLFAQNADGMEALWGKRPVGLGRGTLCVCHPMLLSGGLHQYAGNAGFVRRCRNKGTENFSELGGNDGELSAGWPVLAARGPKQSKIYDGQALEAL